MRKILKGAIVLLIAIAMVFSTVAIADTQTKETTPELNTTHSGSATGARGDIVWDNGMEYDGMSAAQYDSSIPFDTFQADDFHFDEDTEVCDVHWIGGYFKDNYQTGDFDWCISFMIDDGSGEAPNGHPQNPTYAGPFCYTWDEIGKELLQDTGSSIYYKLSVDLPENILFYGCEKYWISIWGVGAIFPQSGWGYHQDPITLNPAVWGSDYWGFPFWTPGYEVLGYDFDMCFQLTTKGAPSIDVEKYVWDKTNGRWVDADTENEALDITVCCNAQFKIVIHNNGEEPLYEIWVEDQMHDSLKYMSADPDPDDYAYDPPYYYLWWVFPGPLYPCETIEIYITAHVEGPVCSYDSNYVYVEANGVSDEDYAWVHAKEKAREFNTPILNWLQNHPNMFPLLQLILKQIGLF